MNKTEGNRERLDKVINHIEQNLDQGLSLADLANLAHYSPYHFQRIFKLLIGETPKQFIIRLRLEKAAHIVVLHPERSMLEVALHVGFKSLEVFSRAFKQYYSISPDNFRKSSASEKVKVIQNPKPQGRFLIEPTCFLPALIDESEFSGLAFEIVRLPLQRVAYLQSILALPQSITENFRKVRQWASARELVKPDAKVFGLIVDHPLFTPIDKCRYRACVAVESQPKLSNLVHYMELPERKYATFKVEGGITEIVKAVTFVANFLLPEIGYKVVHTPAIQVPVHDPLSTPFNKNAYHIYIQVQPI